MEVISLILGTQIITNTDTDPSNQDFIKLEIWFPKL